MILLCLRPVILLCVALLVAPAGMGLAQREPSDHAARAVEPTLDALVRVDKSRVALTLPATGGAQHPLLLHGFEFNGDAVSTDKLHLRQLAPGVFEITSIAYAVGEWRVRIRDSASYYGLGERSDTLNHAHTVVHNLSQATAGAKGSSTARPVPYFMSTTGYGIWFDTTGDATFDLNATSNAEIVVDCDAEKLRVVLFAGPEFPKILAAFTGLAGRADLPPSWAFAPWLSAGAASKARELGLPGSVVLDDAASVTPAETRRVHEQGYKLVLGVSPAVGAKAANYAEAAGFGFLLKQEGTDAGSLIDFTNARAKLWWQEQARQAIRNGADGLMTENAPGEFAEESKFADGTDARMMRNRYGVLYSNAAAEVLRQELKGDAILVARTATAGAGGPIFLMGGESAASFNPEDGLPAAMTAGLNAGMSGMPLWTASFGVGRSSGIPDPRILVRWTEYAAFSPVIAMADSPGRQPWDCGDEALAVYRKYATLHMALFPYRYAAAQEAAKTGLPIMRALALVDQDDEKARQARYEYLFGPDLLVAPIVDEGTQRTVYLPAGEWLDYWTGQPIAGGQTVIAQAAIDSIPVYVRQGAVIPMLPEDIMTLVPTSEMGRAVGDTTLKTMDDRRVYEVFGPAATATTTTADFEGRVLIRAGNTLTTTGDSAAHIILRWRFQKIESATVDGAAANLQHDAKGPFIEFDQLKESTVTWH